MSNKTVLKYVCHCDGAYISQFNHLYFIFIISSFNVHYSFKNYFLRYFINAFMYAFYGINHFGFSFSAAIVL